jgi:putative SOS response-associated peptidase YedK
MCGRYAATSRPEDLVEEFAVERVDASAAPEQAPGPDWNVAPTKPVLVVLERQGREDDHPVRQLRTMRWGLVPSWAKDPSIGSRLINARLETAATKPAFRRAFARRRCIVPADGYYEWYTPTAGGDGGPVRDADRAAVRPAGGARPRKQPFFIHPTDGRPLALAGLYEFWKPADADPEDPAAWLTTVTLLTTTAPDDTGRIHDRAPLLVPAEHRAAWLDATTPFPVEGAELLQPAAPGFLAAYPVSTAVNNVRSNGPQLVEPLPPEPTDPA